MDCKPLMIANLSKQDVKTQCLHLVGLLFCSVLHTAGLLQYECSSSSPHTWATRAEAAATETQHTDWQPILPSPVHKLHAA